MQIRSMRFHVRFLFCATAAAALLLFSAVTPGAQSRPKFYADDPLPREPETQDASKVQEWDIGLIADLTLNLFAKLGDPTVGVRAQNVNTIDEVPDSSWFTNRIYSRAVTVDEITRGPNLAGEPAPGKWTVIRPKTAGTAPGFTIRDDKGSVWFISMDADGYPNAATAAIAVATRMFWALGYYQIETHLTTVRPENVVVGKDVTVRSHGRRRPFTASDVEDVFDRANRSADGSYRVIAQRGLEGKVLGGFKYYGTRPDDPNDIVPHEHRRELRALQVFGGWTNLVDIKAGNTLDTLVTENGRSIVRHYLQDVGSTFGTGSLNPRQGEEGYEYLYEGDRTAARFFTLNFWMAPWQTVNYDEHPEVGLFSAEAYEPEEWKPRVPVGALWRIRPDDELWAALRVMAFTDEHIRAVAKTGQFKDPAGEKLLADVLIQRRNKIGRTYFTKVNPLTRFAFDGSALTFENPAVRSSLVDAPRGGYAASWSRFDNATGNTQAIGGPTTGTAERLQPPTGLPAGAGAYVKVSIAAVEPATASWAKPVDVYFRGTGSGWQLVGVERVPVGPAPNSVKPK